MIQFLEEFFSSRIALAVTIVLFATLLVAWLAGFLPWEILVLTIAVLVLGFIGYAVYRWYTAEQHAAGIEKGIGRLTEQSAADDKTAVAQMHQRWLKGYRQLRAALKRKDNA